jgi:uncharacterized protein (TIGR00730 family)
MTMISVFGGSASRPGEQAYGQAQALGAAIARRGSGVATGGYIGAMEAVSRGAAEAGGEVIGVTCDAIEAWRDLRPNAWVKQEIRLATTHARVLALIELGDLLVALPGGIGTLMEISLAWSLMQIGEIAARPMLLIGPAWREVMHTFRRQAGGYLTDDDFQRISFAGDTGQAVEWIDHQLLNLGGT